MKVGFAFVLSVMACNAHAGLFAKDCNDYNRRPIPMLDQLLATEPKTGQASTSDAVIYTGETEDGLGCSVEVWRTRGQADCNPSSLRYTVIVRTDSADMNQKLCAASLDFGADLEKVTKDRLEYKSTAVYPRIFSSDFERLTVIKKDGDHDFACHSFTKHKEGYRVGHEYRNVCRVKYRPADAVREISHALGEAAQIQASPEQGEKVSGKPSKGGRGGVSPASESVSDPAAVAAPAQNP